MSMKSWQYRQLLDLCQHEMDRVGWTNEQERQHVSQVHKKPCKEFLDEGSLRSFLEYLKCKKNKTHE